MIVSAICHKLFMRRRLDVCWCGVICIALSSACATTQNRQTEPATRTRLGAEMNNPLRGTTGTNRFEHGFHTNGPTGVLTLAQALSLALAQSPELAIYSYDIRIAEAEIIQAGLRPNPEIQAGSENIGGSGQYSGVQSGEHTLQLGQLIELAGKRQKRIEEAQWSRKVVELEYEARKREIFLTTHAAFIEVLAGQRAVEVNQELVTLAEQVLPDIQRRIEAGKTSPLEAQRANVAVANTRIALEQARRELTAARHRLAGQWGSVQPQFSSVEGNLEEFSPAETLEALSPRLTGNPRLARFRAELGQREASLRLEKARAVPDVNVFGGVRAFGRADDAALVVGASIPLPIFNKNQGAILAAKERIGRTESERAAVQVELSTELAQAFHAAQGALDQIRLFRDTVLPQSEQALVTAREGYNAGRFSFLDVLDAQRTLVAARQQYIQTLATYQQAAARVSSLTTSVDVQAKGPAIE